MFVDLLSRVMKSFVNDRAFYGSSLVWRWLEDDKWMPSSSVIGGNGIALQ
jgi:hypothetical protein